MRSSFTAASAVTPGGVMADERSLCPTAMRLRALSIDRPTLIGHSLGAGVVAEIARADPTLVRGIVLADGDARRGGAGLPGWARDLLVDVVTMALDPRIERTL